MICLDLISRTSPRDKKIQKLGSGTFAVYLSALAVHQLRLKAQDDSCQLVEYIDVEHDQLIFKVKRGLPKCLDGKRNH